LYRARRRNGEVRLNFQGWERAYYYTTNLHHFHPPTRPGWEGQSDNRSGGQATIKPDPAHRELGRPGHRMTDSRLLACQAISSPPMTTDPPRQWLPVSAFRDGSSSRRWERKPPLVDRHTPVARYWQLEPQLPAVLSHPNIAARQPLPVAVPQPSIEFGPMPASRPAMLAKAVRFVSALSRSNGTFTLPAHLSDLQC
jgi:hypothetical protein